MPRTHRITSAFLLLALLAAGPAALADPARGAAPAAADKGAAVKGRVFGGTLPVAAATVFAYEVASYALTRVQTDRHGHFLFGALPAGMYQIVAYKAGFAPTTEPLLRRRPDVHQFVEIQMNDESAGGTRAAEDYWAVRSRVPPDVLQEIQSLVAREQGVASAAHLDGLAGFGGALLAHGGVEHLGEDLGSAQLTTAEVDFHGAVGDVSLGVSGQYQQLVGLNDGSVGVAAPDGEVRAIAVEIETPQQDSRITLASSSSELAGLESGDAKPVGREQYRLAWSGRAGEKGRSGLSAQYTEESNAYQGGWLDPAVFPEASRLLNVEGFYRGNPTETTSLKAGVSFRQLDGDLASLAHLKAGQAPGLDSLAGIAEERIGLYGVAGAQIQPRVLVEVGLFSTVRDGSTLSLMPHGGVVVQLGSQWRAETSVSHRLDEEPGDATHHGFSSAFYRDQDSCRHAGEACYEVTFAQDKQNEEGISVGAVHREYAETLRLYFSSDFFDRLESLFVVEGDSVPELQFRMVRRIAPKVLAKLESNFASGGGGIFYATDEQPYENQVRYLVTSLDTRFQQTSTGVFIAFHHLEQALNPVEDAAAAEAPEIEMQRLQLMLTQDLDILANAASNLALRFNLELSRGATPFTLTPDDELHKKLTGGISLSF